MIPLDPHDLGAVEMDQGISIRPIQMVRWKLTCVVGHYMHKLMRQYTDPSLAGDLRHTFSTRRDRTIVSFDLAIGLWMIRRDKAVVDVHQFANILEKLGSKRSTLIGQ